MNVHNSIPVPCHVSTQLCMHENPEIIGHVQSHQTPDLSTEPTHSVFAFGLAAPLSCMYSASSKLVHRSRQSSPRSMLDKSEPIPYKPRVSGAISTRCCDSSPGTGFRKTYPIDLSEEYRADHFDLPRS